MREEDMKSRFEKQQELVEAATASLEKWSQMVNESNETPKKKSAVKKILSTWTSTKSKFKSPDDVIQWYNKNIDDINAQLKNPNLPPKVRKMLERTVTYMGYAVGDGVDETPEASYQPSQDKLSMYQRSKKFIKDHWFKILVLLFIVSLFCIGGSTALATPEVAAAIQAGELAGVGTAIEYTVGGLAYLWNVLLSIVGLIPGLGGIVSKIMIGV